MLSEPVNFPLRVSFSKEMGDRTRQRKSIEPTSSGFDGPLFYRLSYEASREQVADDYGGNCGKCECEGY